MGTDFAHDAFFIQLLLQPAKGAFERLSLSNFDFRYRRLHAFPFRCPLNPMIDSRAEKPRKLENSSWIVNPSARKLEVLHPIRWYVNPNLAITSRSNMLRPSTITGTFIASFRFWRSISRSWGQSVSIRSKSAPRAHSTGSSM